MAPEEVGGAASQMGALMPRILPRIRKLFAALLALVPLALVLTAGARAETRIALVVGNAGYQAGALATPANDAGLIAQTLQAAGFDVVGARDLDQDSLRRALRDFVDKATASGPDTVAFVYLAGYGLQLEGDNYFVPIDARIARDTDVAAQAIRLSDYTRPLAALGLKANVIVLDAAYANPFAASGPALAGGLALVEPEPGMLVAFNATPGTVGPAGQEPYGTYAQALAEMLREGGLPLADAFDRVRLRVNDLSKGAEVPWHVSKIDAPVMLFERAPDAPPPPVAVEQVAAVRAKPVAELPATDAYAAALERDTVQGYSDFIAAYPADPMTPRVRAILAARREAIVWRRSRAIDTPPAYWSYLRRYPEGPHAGDCHRRLAFLAAAFEPPPSFAVLAYDLPPPPPEEIVYVSRPVLVFDDPVYAFAPPPPPPVIFLAPPPPEFVVLLEPPPPPVGLFILPVPVYRPVPVWVRPPVYVAAPPANNVIFANVHNTVVINNVTNTAIVTNPAGKVTTIAPPVQPAPGAKGAPAPVAAFGAALPPSVAQKAALQTTAPGSAPPGTPGPAGKPLPGQPLPGAKGQPLPSPVAPAAKLAPPTTTPPAPGSVKPATTPSPAAPAAKLTPSTPVAPISPVAPTPAPSGNAKSTTPPTHAPATNVPAAKLTTPTAPISPTAPAPAPGPGNAKSVTAPTHVPAVTAPTHVPAVTAPTHVPAVTAPTHVPAGTAPTHVPAVTTPTHAPTVTAPTTAPAVTAPTHVPAVTHVAPTAPVAPIKPAAPPAPPAAKLAPPPPPPAAPHVAPPPPAARLAPPPPPPAPAPPPHPAAPTPPAMAPAAAAARPAAPQPAACPPGKTMAVVNGHPQCK